jgi:hypothetical protein
MGRRLGLHRALSETLGPARRVLLAEMAADAIDLRLAWTGAPCDACDRSSGCLCHRHEAEVRQADAYRHLARELGLKLP